MEMLNDHSKSRIKAKKLGWISARKLPWKCSNFCSMTSNVMSYYTQRLVFLNLALRPVPNVQIKTLNNGRNAHHQLKPGNTNFWKGFVCSIFRMVVGEFEELLQKWTCHMENLKIQREVPCCKQTDYNDQKTNKQINIKYLYFSPCSYLNRVWRQRA